MKIIFSLIESFNNTKLIECKTKLGKDIFTQRFPYSDDNNLIDIYFEDACHKFKNEFKEELKTWKDFEKEIELKELREKSIEDLTLDIKSLQYGIYYMSDNLKFSNEENIAKECEKIKTHMRNIDIMRKEIKRRTDD